MAELDVPGDLKKTPLYDLHIELGARMVPFAGYEMPVQYPSGIMNEHLHTRAEAGLFDVSHMGQAILHGPDHGTTARALEALVPSNMLELGRGRQRYTVLLNGEGGIVDDLMVTRPLAEARDGLGAAAREALGGGRGRAARREVRGGRRFARRAAEERGERGEEREAMKHGHPVTQRPCLAVFAMISGAVRSALRSAS